MPETTPAPRQPAESVWRRIQGDLFRPSRAQLIVAVVLLLSGFAVTLQLSGQRDQRYTNLRQDELVAMLDDVQAEARRLEGEIAQLENTRQRLESGAQTSAVARQEALRRLDALELLGGTAPARGPGIRITINDPHGKLTPEILLNTIEELRDAGAEVMEIDDHVRLVTHSWFATVDGQLQVDGVRVGRTLRLEVIGDPDTLSEATRFRGGLVATIEGERVGGTATVIKVNEVQIDSVVAPSAPRFARPG